MQAGVALFSSLFGGGAAAAGASVGAASASSWLGTAGTILGVGSSLAQIAYQNKIAGQAAATMEANAARALDEGQKSQKDQDQEAALQLAQITASQGASGFSLSSPTFQRIQNRNRLLARRDAERIRQGAADTAQNFNTQAASARNEKQSLLLPAVTGLVRVGQSMVSGANLVRRAKAKSFGNDTRYIEV